MTNRWAKIENERVVEVALWEDGEGPEEDGWVNAGELPVTTDWGYELGKFIPRRLEITSTQFINRFSPQAQGQIAGAAATNPAMLLLLVRLAAAQSIDLTSPEVRMGVQGLVGTILTQGEADAVLSTIDTTVVLPP